VLSLAFQAGARLDYTARVARAPQPASGRGQPAVVVELCPRTFQHEES
jgi:hypothetical protein